jgi:hypothetical protein
MGAYYGGSAFMDGQAKAKANTMVAQAEQVTAAFRFALLDFGGDRDAMIAGLGYGQGGEILYNLTPKYLSQFPKPSISDPVSSPDYFMAFSTVWNGGNSHGDVIQFVMADSDGSNNYYPKNQKICLEITKMANGSSAVIQNIHPLTNKFDCMKSGQYLIFQYRI